MNSTPVYELAYHYYSPIFYYEFLITLHFRTEANWSRVYEILLLPSESVHLF
jgi:hypothetical protein